MTDNDGTCRTVLGQHHLRVGRVGAPAACPPSSGIVPQQPEPAGTIKIFGPDADPMPATAADKYTPLDTLQKLVTYSVQHAPSVAHDFARNR